MKVIECDLPIVVAEQDTPTSCVAACIASALNVIYNYDPDRVQSALIEKLDLHNHGTDFNSASTAIEEMGWDVKRTATFYQHIDHLLSPQNGLVVVLAVANAEFYGPGFTGNHAVLVKSVSAPLDEGQDDFVLQAQREAFDEAFRGSRIVAPQVMDPAPGVEHLVNVPKDRLDRAYKAAGQRALLFIRPRLIR